MRRHDFLRELHRLLDPRTYLEIGVNDGKSLTLSRCPSIGIDPAFKVTAQLRCDVQLVRATSDDFFARPDPIRHLRSSRNPLRNLRRGRPLFGHYLGGTTLDLAFIDGMHLSEFALRDFMNVERFSRWSSVIVFDDMLPRNVAEAARVQIPGDWAGDVFKVIPVLRESRPDLEICLVDTEPTGVAVVFGADPRSTVLADAYDRIRGRLEVPDPQDVPDEVLRRDGALDPEAFLASPVWSSIRRAGRRGRGREAGMRRIREAVAAVPTR